MAKLVAIGDSLTQGFQSLAITHCDQSYAAMIADCLGLGPDEFRIPNFMGSGGLPVNIEWLARKLADEFANDIHGFEWLGAAYRVTELLDKIEDYWERGAGAKPLRNTLYHNLAIWGYEVADAYNISAGTALAKFKDNQRDNYFGIPSEARMRTAYRVLNPGHHEERNADTQIGAAKRIAQKEGGIENLILFLGSNNCLRTVVDLKIRETGKTSPGPFTDFNLWTVEAFKVDYERLADEINSIKAKNVYVATVPHITIPPITRGVNNNRAKLVQEEKYYDYYTNFVVQDRQFDPKIHPHLTRKQATYLDERVDAYNKIIRENADKYKWHVVDICKLLDDFAVRRNHGMPKGVLPPALQGLNSRFFEIEASGRLKNGGLIGLDGVHPTTCGYTLVAQEFVTVMREHNAEIRDVDFEKWKMLDLLVSKPPRTLEDIFGMLRLLEGKFRLVTRMIGKD